MKLVAALALLFFAVNSHATVTPLPGASGQTTRVGAAFPNPIGVMVRDETGAPVAGETVTFNYGAAFGSERIIGDPVYDAGGFYWWATTDANGVATIPFAYGRQAGQAVMTAIGGRHGRAELVLVVEHAAPAATLEVVSGDHQRLSPGQSAPERFSVRVRDTEGRPIPRAAVEFTVSMPASSERPDGVAASGASFDGAYHVWATADADGIAVAPPLTAAVMNETANAPAYGGSVRAAAAETALRASEGLPVASFTFEVAKAPSSKPLQDLWWAGPAESGWGMSIAESGNGHLFIGLFVYGDDGAPTWFVMPGGSWTQCCYGTTYRGTLYRPRGAPFLAYDAGAWDLGSAAGELIVTFVGGHAALVDYRIRDMRGGEFGTGTKRLVRQDFTADLPSPMHGLGGMWWGGPSQNGWGVSIMEQFGNLFSVWFTYGTDGKPTWFVMPAGTWHDAKTYAGDMYVTRSAPWIGRTYDLEALRLTRNGMFKLEFDTPDKGRMEVRMDGFEATLPLERQPLQ